MDPVHVDVDFDFVWEVSQAGYEAVEASPPEGADHKPGTYLVPIVPLGRIAEKRTYRPLDRPALFRTFADTPTTKEGILQFAHEFGLLGFPPTPISPPRGFDPGKCVWSRAESLDSWGAEIEQMQDAIHLYDSCLAEDKVALSKLIRWEPHFLRYDAPKSHFGKPVHHCMIASESGLGYPLSDYKRGDFVGPAWSVLLWIVNVQLQKYPTSPQLFRDTRKPGLRGVARLIPTSLLAALWTQMHHAIVGRKEYDRCHQCGGWFEVVAEKRKDAKFCSNACRFKAYRERQKQAKRLYTEGMRYKQIASKLGSDVETVKGWVAK
jgi:hypothetical protein